MVGEKKRHKQILLLGILALIIPIILYALSNRSAEANNKATSFIEEKKITLELDKICLMDVDLSMPFTELNIVDDSSYKLEFLLFNKSPHTIMSSSGQIDCELSYNIGNTSGVIIINPGVLPGQTGKIEYTVNLSDSPSTGYLVYGLKCIATSINDTCPMHGSANNSIGYRKNALSGANIFLIAQNPRTDEILFLDPIIEDFKESGLIPKAAYTVATRPNEGNLYLFYAENKYTPEDETIKYIKNIIFSRFSHFNNIIVLPLNALSFSKVKIYALDDCTALKNSNGQPKCYLSNYKFNKLNERKNPFTNRILENAENLHIDFIVLIPRLKNP